MTLWRIRATVDDRPGYLSVLTASLALRGVNILSVQVHTTETGAVDEFLVDAPAGLDAGDLVAAVERGRGRDCWVARSEARGLVDQPTRVLGLAGRLAHDPADVTGALRALLQADTVRREPADARPGFTDGTMRLSHPVVGDFVLTRTAPSFTPAEYARGQALLELAATLIRREADRTTLVLPDGAQVILRPATADDLAGVLRMHHRCGGRSRYQRYLVGGAHPPRSRLRRLLTPAAGVTVLALADGEPVAMANLLSEGVQAEVAFLVEDAWQRRGLGRALLRALIERANREGHAALVAYLRAENVAMLRTLTGSGRPVDVDRDGGLLTVTLTLTPATPVPTPGPEVTAAQRG
jgi:hypothetical protein